jgi:hypothetical protein
MYPRQFAGKLSEVVILSPSLVILSEAKDLLFDFALGRLREGPARHAH